MKTAIRGLCKFNYVNLNGKEIKLQINNSDENDIKNTINRFETSCYTLSKNKMNAKCDIYEIRPCVCWTYRNYKNKSECQKCFNPEHSCAFVSLDTVMTKDMYNHGSNIIKHQEYYLLIYAIAKILFIC